jgi:hypothetical protein
MRPETRAAVLRTPVLRTRPPRGQLNAHELAWGQQITSAWVDGEIPGFPDETEWNAAGSWLLHVCREAEAQLRRGMFARGEIPAEALPAQDRACLTGGDETSSS